MDCQSFNYASFISFKYIVMCERASNYLNKNKYFNRLINLDFDLK